MKSIRLAWGLLFLIHAPSLFPAAAGSGRAEYALVDIDTVGAYGGTASMVLGTDGLPVFSYMKDQAGRRGLWVAKCTEPECSGSIVRTKVDSSESFQPAGSRFHVGDYSSIKLTASGLPIISYLDVWGQKLKVVQCGNASCSEKNAVTTLALLDGISAYRYATSLQIGPGGLPSILFQGGEGQISIATCALPSCTTGATVSYPMKISRSSMPSMLVQDNGRPLLIGSGINGQGGGLSFARCEDARCQGIGFTELDAGILPLHSAVKKGAEGFPVIAAFGEVSRKLDLIKCLDAYCIDNKKVGLVDSAGTYGWSPALAIRPDGNPVVAYKDMDCKLKVAYCGNAWCSTGNRYVPIDAAANSLLDPLSLGMAAGGGVYLAFTSGGKVRIAYLPTQSSAVRRNRVPAAVRENRKRFGGRTLSGRAS